MGVGENFDFNSFGWFQINEYFGVWWNCGYWFGSSQICFFFFFFFFFLGGGEGGWGLSTSELRVRLAPLNRFKPSSNKVYWPFQGSTSFVDLLYFFFLSCVCYAFVSVCLYVPCGHLLGKGWPLGSRLWCPTVICHFPIGILGQVRYMIISIPDICTLTYLYYLTWADGSEVSYKYTNDSRVRLPSVCSPSVNIF